MADSRLSKPVCKYGSSCYRKNPDHLKAYFHPSKINTVENQSDQPNDDPDVDSPATPPSKRPRLSKDDSEIIQEHENDGCHSNDIKEDMKEKNEGICNSIEGIDSSTCDDEVGGAEKGGSPCITALSTDPRQRISELYLVSMPKDFYQLWDTCLELNPGNPSKTLEPLGLYLTGPYDVLHDNIPADRLSWEQCVIHGRHYYDPPELVTVIMDNDKSKGYHIGYFRDDPNSDSCLVVCNAVSDGCTIQTLGTNIFTALLSVCQSMIKPSSKDKRKLIQSLQDTLTRSAHSLGIDLKPFKVSDRKPVSKCFNQIGISVPVDTVNDVGYRSLTMTNKQLKNVLNDISLRSSESAKDSLRELVTYVQFANDECDYGMGLELGIDLFCYGDEVFHDRVLHLLTLAYELLDRQQYGKIIEQHLKNRRKPKFVLHE